VFQLVGGALESILIAQGVVGAEPDPVDALGDEVLELVAVAGDLAGELVARICRGGDGRQVLRAVLGATEQGTKPGDPGVAGGAVHVAAGPDRLVQCMVVQARVQHYPGGDPGHRPHVLAVGGALSADDVDRAENAGQRGGGGGLLCRPRFWQGGRPFRPHPGGHC